MIVSLIIENIAVIESAQIEFGSGLNVLTGETGAGKSIIIDSINAVLGERTSRELIRTGETAAKVTAVFSDINDSVAAVLDDLGVEKSDDKTLIITRSISADGRNTCRINGMPATVSMLKAVGATLINIHGQHDNQALMSPEQHYKFIDKIAGNSQLLASYKSVFTRLVAVKKELDRLCEDENEKASRLELLNFQIDEIENAAVTVGERDALVARKTLLQNSKRVISALEKARAALDSSGNNDSALSALEDCAGNLETAAKYYEAVDETAVEVRGICYDLADCAAQVNSLLYAFSFNPNELNEIEERLDFLFRLSLKYGAEEQDILDFLENAKAQRGEIELSDKHITELENELDELSEQVTALAAKLTESRMAAARFFEKRVKEELEFLNMPHTTFVVDRRQAPLSSRGADTIEFLISANAGQEPKPLAKTASGGELSRIMLAIKSVNADIDEIQTLIFDEIDTGVSGNAAHKVALKLRQVGKNRQVICVTHLAQIAAQADSHMRITKNVHGDKTFTQVDTLDFEGRVAEIARINADGNLTALQLETAKEMLMNAKENAT